MTLPPRSANVRLSRAHRFERAQQPTVTASSGAADETPGKCPIHSPDGDAMTSPETKQTAPEPTAEGRLELQSRAELRDLLIAAGLARGAAEKISKGGWPALIGEITETDLAEECADLARTLAETFKDF